MNDIEKVIESFKEHYNYTFPNNSNYPIEIELEKKDINIILSDELKSKLNNIKITTDTDTNEIGFICYGKEYLNNQILLDEIIISDSAEKSEEVLYGPIITEQLNRRIEHNIDERTVIAIGHTHPKISPEYMHFSVCDLATIVNIDNRYEKILNKEIKLLGILISDKLKYIYYDDDINKFYSIEENKVN